MQTKNKDGMFNMDRDLSIRFLAALVPGMDEIISYMEKNHGWLPLNEYFIQAVLNLKLRWWEFYEDEPPHSGSNGTGRL